MPSSDRKFEVCPEFKGRAVCVDVTPLKRYETAFGPKDKFKLVLEVDLEREDGSRFAVWSKPFTPSSHERSAFAAFMKDWFGRPLTKEDWDKLDTEDLVGRAAEIVVVHEHVDGETYANIKLIMPDRSSDVLKPSGKFVRVKDRQAGPGPNVAGAAGGGGYRRMEQPSGGGDGEHASVKIHVGRCKGLELRDLAPEQVQALIEKWLPTAKANPKPLADDKRLMAALEWWKTEHAVTATEEDNVPF
jgi:hypothetical protein